MPIPRPSDERFNPLEREARLYLRGPRVEASLHGDPETFLRILAAAREGTDSVEELLKEAAYYDTTVGPDLLDARDDTVEPRAEFQVDVPGRRLVFPGNRVEFSRRGVLPLREGSDERPGDLRTFVIPADWDVLDSDDNERPLDEKGARRREKELWLRAIPPPGGPTAARVDGVDLTEEELRDLRAWTLSQDERPPQIQGKSVYELVHEGMRKGAAKGRRSSKPHRADASPGAR